MMLESKGATKTFGAKVAIDHVDLALEPGHIYAMMGPNGSGKTTWMKLAAGLLKPTSGGVFFEGEPVSISSRRGIAYVSTEPYFYPWMTVLDAGKYYQDFFEDFSMERYHQLLRQVKVPEKTKITSLSTGLTAKMKVAVTLARDARVYMMDEPFNGIDLLARDEIRDIVLQAAAPEKLMLISSHLVEEMENIADKAVFISEGRLIEVRDLREMQAREGKTLSDRYREIYGHRMEV